MYAKNKFIIFCAVVFSATSVFGSSAENIDCDTKCFGEILGRVSFYSVLVDEINRRCGTRLDNFESQLDSVLYARFSIRTSQIYESEVQPKLTYEAGVDSVIDELLSEKSSCEYEVDNFYLYLSNVLLNKDVEYLRVFRVSKDLNDYFNNLKK